MARQRQQRKGLLQQLAALLAGFASACKTLLEAALEWWRGVPPPEPADPLLDASSKASRAERRAAAKAAAAAAAGGSKARAPQPPSESESSDEEEAPPAPAAPGSGFAAFATVEPGWEAVSRVRKTKAKPAPPAGGPKLRAAAAAGKKAAAAEPSRGTCERPGCGLPVGRGFAKCADCKLSGRDVFYCSPACQMSDWKRHQDICTA